MILIGNCGWAYLNAEKYFGKNWKNRFKSKLQAYAKLFDLAEVNYSFYRIPKTKTAKRWLSEAREVNDAFQFTVKCFQGITHWGRFSSSKSIHFFKEMKKVGKALKARVLLFQTPASFKPTQENLKRAEKFFKKIDRERFSLVWEVRWKENWGKEIVQEFFKKIRVEQCVDPFKQELFYAKKFAYFRLHGPRESMYGGSYSKKHLKELKEKLLLQGMNCYVLFNNSACYENALALKDLM